MTLLFWANFQARGERYRTAPGENAHLCIGLFFRLTILAELDFQASKRLVVKKYFDPGGQVFS